MIAGPDAGFVFDNDVALFTNQRRKLARCARLPRVSHGNLRTGRGLYRESVTRRGFWVPFAVSGNICAPSSVFRIAFPNRGGLLYDPAAGHSNVPAPRMNMMEMLAARSSWAPIRCA